MKKIAVFVSGGGSNFMAIHHQIQKREIPGEIVLVISNNPNCDAIEYANENSIPIIITNEKLVLPQSLPRWHEYPIRDCLYLVVSL